ncbi:hypothetical protein PGT21_035013 [Puccinia graminis f. sp. tritici]|uniref:F-box domain-containing protein n=1 Tax=Puccinia graminis f. sp. tritici TaxID=56615 RepID=A0A5B0QCT2_PUCGR|nr:hypothetical protein PGT21_035013 [Puccinia graminis f. sp. tritici]
MRTILDLPWDLFEDIFKHLNKEAFPLNRSDSVPGTRTITGRLRLVCRQWADWLYVNYLYRSMTFRDASQAMRFIDQTTKNPTQLPNPRCQELRIFGILTWGSPPSNRGSARVVSRRSGRTITPEILEALIDFFSDTVVELYLRFYNVISLSTQIIGSIGRMKNLRDLKLGHELKAFIPTSQLHFPMHHDDDDDEFEADMRQQNIGEMALAHMVAYDAYEDEPPSDMDPIKSKIDHDSLRSLIMATRTLESLDLLELDPICLPRPFNSAFLEHQIPSTITRLEISMAGESLSRLRDLSLILKRTLKVLSLQNSWGGDYREKLVPIFENLRETLEGLFVTDLNDLTPTLQLEFPKLRVFRAIFWDGRIGHYLNQPMFSSAPLDVLVISSKLLDRPQTVEFGAHPFPKLSMLRRLVLCECHPDFALPPEYLEACVAGNVQPVYLSPWDNDDISSIMSL